MKYLVSAIALSLVVACIAILSRPILPIDETRYIGVAWESFHTGDFLVSHINGATYAHKPPLLFWLIGAVWSLTGVTEYGARLVGPLAGIMCLPLIRWLSLRLWPSDPRAANCSPLIFASFAPWLLFAPLTMFDALLTLTTLIALCGVLKASQGQQVLGWLLAGLGMGLGILTKGPVIFVHVLPTAILGVWWMRGMKRDANNVTNSATIIEIRPIALSWYLGALGSIVVAAAIGLSWAIPSAIAGGEAYGNELLLGQTTGRVVKSFSHRHHLLWYLPLLPLCTLPWLMVGTIWRGVKGSCLDCGLRFATSWIVGSLLILSLISGKQVHYLMPIFPAFALVFGRLMSLAPGGVTAKDLRFLAASTMAVGCVPLLLNHVALFQELGLASIVPDMFAPLLIGCGILLLYLYRDQTEPSVLGISTVSAASICLIILAGTINFWQGFNLDGLARYAANSQRPIAWYGEYHAQLNFAGRLDHLDVVRSDKDLESWIQSNPRGLLIVRLVSQGPVWSEFYKTSATEREQTPTADQRSLIDQLMEEKPEFVALQNKADPVSIFWVRNGLKRKPFVVFSFEGYKLPEKGPELASEAQIKLQ